MTTTTGVKTSPKDEFAFFQTLSRLFDPAQFVKCTRLNSYGPLSSFKKKKEYSSSYVHVLHKKSHWEDSRRSRVMDVKEMY